MILRSIFLSLIGGLFLLLINSCSERPGVIFPEELLCEYASNPLGVDTQHPRLSWKLTSIERNQIQARYEIQVASSEDILIQGNADVWNSGIIESDQSIHIPYAGVELRSGEKYFWRVRTWDKDSNGSPWSKPASWEMGLLHPDDWKGEWIGYECEAAPLFRKEFEIEKDIERATAFISGLGYFELRINGNKVGDHVLDPGQTDYELRTFYVSHDVTRNLEKGNNALGIELGNGFYNQATVNNPRFGWGDVVYGKPRFLAQFHIRFKDGTDTLIISDRKWRAAGGPTTFNNVYVGDYYDASLEKDGWDRVGFDDSTWEMASAMDPPGGKMVSQKIQPIKRMNTISPVGLVNPRPGVFVFDMGQNFAGWARLKVNAQKGTEIVLRFSEEVFGNGDINPASCGGYATSVVQTDKYLCKGTGEVEIWEPRYTYHGFRYVEMTGFPGRPTLENLEGIVVHTSAQQTGTFSCSDTMINRIHHAAYWTLISNMHSILEDCPHREKCGWLGDIMPEVLMFNMDVPLLMAKIERDIETSRLERKPGNSKNNAAIYHGIPWDVSPGRRVGGHAADWCSKYIQLPWFMFVYYGDISLAGEHWEGMTHFMNHLGSIARDHIIYEGYGDMFQPGIIMPVNPPKELTTTALYYFNSVIMSSMAGILGFEDEAVSYQELALDIKDAFNNKFYNSEEKWYGSQTASSMAMEFGLVPEGDQEAVVKSLVKDVVEIHQGHFSTGQMGGRYLHEALGNNGFGHIAKAILNQTTYPSIGYLLERGATTFWESWGEEEIDKNSSGVRSRNHPFQAGVDDWFFKGIGGINPDPRNPGFKNIIFRTEMTGCLTWASTAYQSMYGLIKSDWKIEDGEFKWSLSVPVNSTATVYLPTTDLDDVLESGKSVIESDEFNIIGREEDYSIIEIGSGNYFFELNQGTRSTS